MAVVDVECRTELGAESARELAQRIAAGVALSGDWQVKLGAARVEVHLHPEGSLEPVFPYKQPFPYTIGQTVQVPGDTAAAG